MALQQAVWECPCCGAQLLVIADLVAPAAPVVPVVRKPRRKRRTKAEMALDEELVRAAREPG